MSETTPPPQSPPPQGTPPQGGGAAAGGQGQQQPQLQILAQYVKDLSFENPGAPHSLSASRQQQPQIDVHVDVNVSRLGEGSSDYEVALTLETKAKSGEQTTFVTELVYGGIFRLSHIPEESLQPVLLIECPRQIFPFARRVLADVTRDGGFPPLMIEPIDFAALYRQQMARAQSAQNAPEAGGAGDRGTKAEAPGGNGGNGGTPPEKS